MSSNESLESWKESLTNRAEEAANKTEHSPDDVLVELQDLGDEENFKNKMYAQSAAEFRLIAADPIARGLYDELNDAKTVTFDILNKIEALIPVTEDLKALALEQIEISNEASRGEYREGEIGELQKQLKIAMGIENKAFKIWLAYSTEHRIPFLKDSKNAEEELVEAHLAEKIRQKNRKEWNSL